MEQTRHKSLALILARELASNVAVPMFLVDSENTLVFYNEAANVAFGGPFGKTGELRHGEWAPRFNPTKPDGTPYQREQMPMVIALQERRPAYGEHLATDPDGRRRRVALTAIPLFSSPEDFVGVIATFWEVTDDGSAN
ncbi:MAG: PAS domain-containing protein [Mycobacteriales bacterium]